MAKTTKTKTYHESVGRRKSAVARVRLYIAGKDKHAQVGESKLQAGDMMVNGKPLKEYFPTKDYQTILTQPFVLTANMERFVTSIMVTGGGVRGQVAAVVLGLSRALQMVDSEMRAVLKKEGLLRRDPRTRERRMVGTGGKSRRAKQSPKR